jgi:integrase
MSEEEVTKLFQHVDNLKHKCILMTLYSGGLRLSEVVNLKISDIDSKRMMIFIRGGKGRGAYVGSLGYLVSNPTSKPAETATAYTGER